MEPRHHGLEHQANVQPGPGGGLSSPHLSLLGALQARFRAGDDDQATDPSQNQARSAESRAQHAERASASTPLRQAPRDLRLREPMSGLHGHCRQRLGLINVRFRACLNGSETTELVKGYGRRPAQAERPGSWPASVSRPRTNARGSSCAMGIWRERRERDGATARSGGHLRDAASRLVIS